MNPQTPHISNTNSTKALQLAATAKSNALMYAVLATAISRDEDVEAMCQSVGMRYGQIRLLAAGDLYSTVDKLGVYEELDSFVSELKDKGFSLVAATREAVARASDATNGVPLTIIYVVACPAGSEPEHVAVSRKERMG